MEMFNEDLLRKRIGPLKKSVNLEVLEEVERYVVTRIREYGIECNYDVIAEEMPCFKTIGYTEYATNFFMAPLNLNMRLEMFTDAENDKEGYPILDYVSYLADNITNNLANKYMDRQTDFDGYRDVKNIVVLPGSNKLKTSVCLNKLKAIKNLHGDDIYFKPHPITTYAMVGEMKDLFGEDCVLPRDIDLYHFLAKADKVYTTHISESAVYALALGKEIEPTDVYNGIRMGSFYPINYNLFKNRDNGKEWINRVFSNPKSGMINPVIDVNWKAKVDSYLEYIMANRIKYKGWFIETRKPKKDKSKDK